MTATSTDTERDSALIDARLLLEWWHPGQVGKVCIDVGYGPHYDDNGKYQHADFRAHVVDFADIDDDLIERLLAIATNADVFTSPNLVYKSRRAGSVVGPMVIHCDWDGSPSDLDALLDVVRELNGAAVASGTTGHVHVHIPLASAITPAEHRRLCRALHGVLPPGSDVGKSSANDLLRLPGTYNHKAAAAGGEPTRVRLLIRPRLDGPRWDPAALAARLGAADEVSGESEQPTPGQATAPSHERHAESVELRKHPNVSTALSNSVRNNSGLVDRSKTTAAVVESCVEDGLTLAQTRWVVDQRADLRSRVEEFLARPVPLDDVAVLFGKAHKRRERVTRIDVPPQKKSETVPVLPRVWHARDLSPARQASWLARNWLPSAAVALLIGEEGIGKSLLWVLLTRHITTGEPMPELGLPARKPQVVLIVVTEDDWETTVLPRMEVAGVDIDMVRVICTDSDGSGSPIFPRDMHLIYDMVDSVALVLVDAWLDTVPAGISVRDPQQARQALHPFKELATKTGCSVLLLCHTNRVASANPRDRYGATGELRKKARMTLYAQQDADGHLVVGPEKMNTAAPVAAAKFAVTAVPYFPPNDDHDGTVARLDYIGASEMTAREHLAQSYAADHAPDASTDAVAWLAAVLGEGPRWAAEVYAAGETHGHSEDQLKRAKQKLRAESKRDGDLGRWLWRFPHHKGRGIVPFRAPLPPSSLNVHAQNHERAYTSEESMRANGEGREAKAAPLQQERADSAPRSSHPVTPDDTSSSVTASPVERCGACGQQLLYPASISRGVCGACWKTAT